MESIIGGGGELGGDASNKKTFLSHVFSSTEEGKAEILNVIQYSAMAVVPVVVLNKLIQRFIPEAEIDKSSLELLAEIFIQLIVMFCGMILIHRIITYFPTYSGFKYENLTLTNVIIAFLIIVLSIQTKLGLKVNILAEQIMDLWNGTGGGGENAKKNMRKREPMVSGGGGHAPSQADYIQESAAQNTMFPPMPAVTSKKPSDSYNYMMSGGGSSAAAAAAESFVGYGPQPANFNGNVFGSAF